MPGCSLRAYSVSIIVFDFSSKWKGSHGMPEVFSIMFFDAWLHVRKIVSKVKALLSWFHSLFISSNLTFFFIKITSLFKQTTKRLAVFSKATHFRVYEVYGRKGVINSPL